MNKRKNNYLTLLLFLTLVSLISLVSDKETMGFYQLSALSFSLLSSISLPAIDSSIAIIAISILSVIAVALIVIRLLRRTKKINGENNDGQEILAKTETQEQTIDKASVADIVKQEQQTQLMDSRLAQYVRDARAASLSDEIILGKLREAGWPEETIKQAL